MAAGMVEAFEDIYSGRVTLKEGWVNALKPVTQWHFERAYKRSGRRAELHQSRLLRPRMVELRERGRPQLGPQLDSGVHP